MLVGGGVIGGGGGVAALVYGLPAVGCPPWVVVGLVTLVVVVGLAAAVVVAVLREVMPQESNDRRQLWTFLLARFRPSRGRSSERPNEWSGAASARSTKTSSK